MNNNYRAGTENGNIFVDYGYQNYNGYRDHSSSKRNYFTLSGDFSISDHQSVSFLTLVNTVDDKFPGEVDSITYANVPKAANPDYIQKDIGLISKISLPVLHILIISQKIFRILPQYLPVTIFQLVRLNPISAEQVQLK